MAWTRMLAESELPDGARRVVEISGRSVLVLRHGGRVYAIDAVCPHMGARLDDGRITDDGIIVCPRHRSEFDLRTGAVRAWAPWPPIIGGLLGAIRQQRPLPVFATRIEDGAIWLDLDATL